VSEVGPLRGNAEVVIRAPAKVNLALEVLRRRRDGYHEVRTVLQTISLCDRIRLKRAGKGLRLRCRNFPDSGPSNLAWQAADLFLRRVRPRGGLEIELEKRIPVGGGLGGGSSDAAAVLLGACRLFGVRPATEELLGWAAELGSDVPFFILGGAALGRGRGEQVEPLRPGDLQGTVLLFIPSFSCPTAAVYGAYRQPALTRRKDRLNLFSRHWKKRDIRALGGSLFNDLEGVVFHLHPGLAEVRERFLEAGAAGARVSGSGSCLFGLFISKEEARGAAKGLRKDLPGRIVAADFLASRKRWGVVKR
jgi:4-diphosphocytidyl-2-C-methyl-D-erythritol kinase